MNVANQSNTMTATDYRKFDLLKAQMSSAVTEHAPDFEAATSSSSSFPPSPALNAATAAADADNILTSGSVTRLQMPFNGATHFDQTSSQRTPLSTLNIDVQRSPRYAHGRLTPEVAVVGRYDADRLRRRVFLPPQTLATTVDADGERLFHRVTSSADRRFPSPAATFASTALSENFGNAVVLSVMNDVQRHPRIHGEIKSTSSARHSVDETDDSVDETGDALRASLSVTATIDGVLTSSMWRPW
jgi:hypothetical protein